MERFLRSVNDACPFTAPETNTARRGGSERPKAGITPAFLRRRIREA